MQNVVKIFIGVIGIAVVFLLNPFATIPAGYRGVLTTFGKPSDEVYSEGIHFVWPIAQSMHRVAVAIQKGEGDGDGVGVLGGGVGDGAAETNPWIGQNASADPAGPD